MLRMITGLPGHNKTSNTLALFLAEKGKRPLYATHINGFDYEKHDVQKLESLEGIFTLPAGSLILCDEAQKFMRARDKTAPVPKWITEFETHRHLGIDLWFTTQHPMLIDVHVRRLTEEHWHYVKPFGIKATATVRKWSGRQDDPTDYHAVQLAEIVSAKPPKAIFAEYESTVLDTSKGRIPRKLIYASAALGLLLCFVGYKAYQLIYHSRSIENVKTLTAPESHLGQMTAFAPASSSGVGRPITLTDFRPVHPMLPWTAPVYASAVHIVAAPHFAGCISSVKAGCFCTTQQGTSLAVEASVCDSIVKGHSMPFNPFHADSPDYQPQQAQPLQVASADTPRPSVVVGETSGPSVADRSYKSIFDRH